MATDTTLASIEEQQNILRQKAAAARQAYLNATTDAEKDRIQAERDSYRKQISDLSTQKEVISNQDPATSTYAGVDRNSGREKYYNPVTGQMYLSDTKPSDTQKVTFENTVNQSGAPVDPANAATSTPPAVATASLPVDINQTAALTEGQVSNAGDKTIKEQVGPPEQTTVAVLPVTTVVVEQQPLILGSDPAPGTASPILSPEESIAKAQQTGENYGQNAADALRVGQTGDAVDTTNTPKTGALPEAVPVDDSYAATKKAVSDKIAPGANDDLNNRSFASSPGDEMSNAAAKAVEAKAKDGPEVKKDWRVKLALSSNASSWAKDWFGSADTPTILSPLREMKGVTFPYNPTIQMG